MSRLIEVARARGLVRCAELIASSALPEPAPVDALLSTPLATTPLDALEQLPRRGLDPGLVMVLLPWFEDRPLERGLFAWDVLCRAILGPEHGALVAKLRGYAHAIQPVLPAAGSNFANLTRRSSQQAVEEYAAPQYRAVADDDLTDVTTRRALGALDEMRRRHGAELVRSTTIPETTRQFAIFLHLAHLSTLSSFYLDYLWNAIGYAAALPDLIEVLADVGARTVMPSVERVMGGKSAQELELAGYMAVRQELIAGRHKSTYEEVHRKTRDEDYRTATVEQLAPFSLSHVAYAQAALEVGKYPVPFALLNHIVEKFPNWRYAFRLRLLVAAALADPTSDSVLQLVDQFLARFGNEFGMWNLTGRYGAPDASWQPGLRRLLGRELVALPHDWSAWVGLARLLKGDQALAEIDARVTQQCKG